MSERQIIVPVTSGGVGAGAPTDAQYLVAVANGDLSAERVPTNTATVTWDFGTAAQAKANVPDAGITYAKIQNVSATDKLLGRVSALAGVVEEVTCTDFAQSLLDDADATAGRATLALGTIATQAANNVSISGGAIIGITDLAVADGGTGSSTAAGAATNLGLGTGDSPQFAAVNIGAATDTTITRTGAGDIAVEGNAIYRAGGTDVPITDGGTGSSTQAGAQTNLGVAPAQDTFIFGTLLSSFAAPVDNTNHFLPIGTIATATAPTAGPIVALARRAGTITDVRFAMLVSGTNGSGETGSLIIRVNDTTDTTVVNNTLVWNTGATLTNYTATGLTIALAAGDYFIPKIDPPTWATNPTNVFYLCQVTVTYP